MAQSLGGRDGSGVWRNWAAAAAAALALVGQAAVAQEGCGEVPVILTLADEILAGRAELTGFTPGRIGAEAAYLAIHYGALDDAAALALIDSLLEGRRHAGATELRGAFLVARHGVDEGLALIDPDPLRALVESGPSVQRAVMVADAGASYFRLMREAGTRPEFADRVGLVLAGGAALPALVSDMPDKELAQVVAAAEAEGFARVAVRLAAGVENPAFLEEAVRRHADDPAVVEMLATSWQELLIPSLRHGTGPLARPDPALQAERSAGDGRYYAVMRAAYESGPAAMIATTLNMTGREVEVAAASVAYLAAVEAGQIDPLADPEAAWLMQYRALALALEPDVAASVMLAFDFPPLRVRHYAGLAIDSLDWMLAAEALAPVVRNEVAVMPARPALMTGEFDWEMWSRTAQTLAAGPAGAFPVEEAPVAAELLARAGRFDEMQAVAAVLEPFERLDLLRDVMQRLDAQCEAALYGPGQGFLLGGDVMYRF